MTQDSQTIKEPPAQSSAIASTDRLERLAQSAAAGGVAYFLVHSATVITGPERRLMAWLYDDSFYYMIVAKHFSERHISSFDGITLTNGYHPLWMWLCSLVYGMRGLLDLTYVRLCMTMTVCIVLALLLAALRESLRASQRESPRKQASGWLWALALGATSYSALNNGLTVMEWPLVVLFWALLHRLMMRSVGLSVEPSIERPPLLVNQHWRLLCASALIGIAGSLSRTDFGLIPACYFLGGLMVARRFKCWGPARAAAAALAGAVAGLGLVFAYNRRMTGAWLQQSAQVKHVAASLAAPFNPVPTLWQFTRVLLYLPPQDMVPSRRAAMLRLGIIILLPVGLAAALLLLARWRLLRDKFRQGWFNSPSVMLAQTSAVLGVFGYLLVYSFNSQATYGWYTATVTGFILVLAARRFSSLGLRASAAIVLPLMIYNVAACSYFGGNARAQYLENSAGKLMHQDHAAARMGGGDVGKPSFYNYGEMINLDGLMNNEVVPYLVAGKIHCYVLKRQIQYLSSTGSITQPVTNAERAARNEAPLPWDLYFKEITARSPDGEPATYLKTNFEAIRDSGECSSDLP